MNEHHHADSNCFKPLDCSSEMVKQRAYQTRFLDAAQAAAFLGDLNSRTVTRWAREGYLPAYPIGEGKRRLWRFLPCDLERWMLSRMTGTLAGAVDAPTRGFIQ